MAAGVNLETEGIALADMTLPRPMFQAFAAQRGRFDRIGKHAGTLTIMVKIRDDIGGSLGPVWVNKRLQDADRSKLKKGEEMARAILKSAGARSIFTSHHFAAHPGGSIRIGTGVDSTLQTSTPKLHVCDASVIPEAWGRPPTLTLLCLGTRLGEQLAR
jgi:choline dehydrogenase-like flavoprotein